MAFQMGTLRFIVEEFMPRVSGRGAVLSLARQRITSDPAEVIDYLAASGFDVDFPDMRTAGTLTTREMFRSLGFDAYDDVDFTPEEACTIVHDMNQPLPEAYHDRYDLVFEMGTLEHIFDVKTSFQNIIAALKTGGSVIHLAPLNFINHGFYNFSPTLFHDVYRVNGFADLDFYLLEFPLKWWKNPLTPYRRLEFSDEPMRLKTPKGYFLLLGFIARKKERMERFTSPIQAYYDPDWPGGETI
jgi:SAM-dependent methyltransferase